LQDIFKTRLAPATLVLNSSFNIGAFEITYNDRVTVPDYKIEDISANDLLEETVISELLSYIDNLPITCERGFEYPPLGRVREYSMKMKEQFITIEESIHTMSNKASFVNRGAAFAANFPILLFGTIFKCHYEFLPTSVIEDCRSFKLSENVYFQPSDPYQFIKKISNVKYQVSSLYFPSTRYKNVAIAFTRRYIQSGFELCFEHEASKPKWRITTETRRELSDVAMTSYFKQLERDRQRYRKNVDSLVIEEKRASVPTKTFEVLYVFLLHYYIKIDNNF
jgi:hypothetical protein